MKIVLAPYFLAAASVFFRAIRRSLAPARKRAFCGKSKSVMQKLVENLVAFLRSFLSPKYSPQA